MMKSKNLIKGNTKVCVAFIVVYSICFLGIDKGFKAISGEGVDSVWGKILQLFVRSMIMSMYSLFGLVTQTIIYFICKSYHHEDIDKSSIANHLEDRNDYVALDTKDEVQMHHSMADDPGRTNKDRRKRRVHDEEDEPDSDSHPRSKRAKQPFSSDSDDKPDGSRLRLNRLEKALFGDRRADREPVVTQEIEQYRPPPGEERQFPKMSEFSGKEDPEDHCEKYELVMVGMGHNDIMLCKMFKTYLKGSASMWYKSLKPRSIGSYEQLKMKFLKYYSHLCRKAKDTEALVLFSRSGIRVITIT
ncbi:hypothetical protein AgCh_008459 [Apium graveolens]